MSAVSDLFLILRCMEYQMTFWSNTAQRGASVHLLKAGSKRKRTQAEMREQYDMEQLAEFDKQEQQTKTNEMEATIKKL